MAAEPFDAYVRRVAPADADVIMAEVERLRANLAAIRCEIDARGECADMATVRFYANEDTDMRVGKLASDEDHDG